MVTKKSRKETYEHKINVYKRLLRTFGKDEPGRADLEVEIDRLKNEYEECEEDPDSNRFRQTTLRGD